MHTSRQPALPILRMGVMTMVSLFCILLFAGAATAQQAATGEDGSEDPAQGGEGQVVFFVFDGDVPVQDVELRVDGQTLATTGEDGGVFASIPAGRSEVELVRNGETVVDLDLLTTEGEQIQVVATLREGQKPKLDIESTGSGPVLAQDDAGEDEFSQKRGLLEGTIYAGQGGPAISNARIRVEGAGRTVRTNEQGVFQIELPPGNYSLTVTHPDYDSRTIDNVRVIPGKAVTADLNLGTTGVELADYVVTASYEPGSVADTFAIQRESSQVSEVLGAEQIARTGDSDAAEALERVTGLTLERDKFIVVRGQPFRYTQTLFNGSPLPSPDPVRQVTPLDLFPANILRGIQVIKAYTPNLPGSFGAGLVKLDTSEIPQKGFAELQVSTAYHSDSTFEEDGLNYNDSTEDFLGQDDGLRDLPAGIAATSPSGSNSFNQLPEDRQTALARDFNDFFLVKRFKAPPDIGFQGNTGKAFATQYGRFGVLVSGAYEQEYRTTTEIDRDFRLADGLVAEQDFVEQRTDQNVQLSGLLALSGDWDSHTLDYNSFFIRDTQDRTQFSQGDDLISDDREERRFLLEFNQRETLVNQLIGGHDFEVVKLDWRTQFANSERDRPDRRTYQFERAVGSDNPFIFGADAGLDRDFNVVDDDIFSFAGDFTIPVSQIGVVTPEIMIGGSYSDQDRSSDTRRFEFQPNSQADLNQPIPELVVNDFTIGDTVDLAEVTEDTDSYEGTAEVLGVYGMVDLNIDDRFRVVGGLRQEMPDYEVETGLPGEPPVSMGGFDVDETLPALAVTWYSTPSTQVRASYGRTLSYPVLIELSDTLFFDPNTGEEFTGNPDLVPTEFDNFDLRWEWYPSSVETVTAGVFYKDIKNPIERQFVSVGGGGGGDRTTFINGESGEVIGVELGGRMRLDWLNSLGLVPRNGNWGWLANMYAQGNIALIDSEVVIGSEGGTATNNVRKLTGQADNVINFQVGYDGRLHDVTLAFNRVGERIDRAGVNGLPDVVQEPINRLDLTYSWQFLKNLGLKFKAQNLLDEDEEFTQGSLLERRITQGVTLGASMTMSFSE